MIDVDVEDQHGLKRVSVHVDDTELNHKPYLGGFRNKKTQQLYHHAMVQTCQFGRKQKATSEVFCRDSQTVDVKSCGTQSLREAATQMDRPELLLDASYDRILVAGKCSWEISLIYEKKTVKNDSYGQNLQTSEKNRNWE